MTCTIEHNSPLFCGAVCFVSRQSLGGSVEGAIWATNGEKHRSRNGAAYFMLGGHATRDRAPSIVPLMGLPAGPERSQLAAERHSDKRAAFPGLETGPVKGMTF